MTVPPSCDIGKMSMSGRVHAAASRSFSFGGLACSAHSPGKQASIELLNWAGDGPGAPGRSPRKQGDSRLMQNGHGGKAVETTVGIHPQMTPVT